MTQNASVQPEQPYQGLLTQLGEEALGVDWRRWLIAWIGTALGIYAISIPLTASPQSIHMLVQRDYGWSPVIFVMLFLFGVGHYLRGLRPRYSLLTSLVGWFVYSIFTVHYLLRGEITLTLTCAHLGTFVVCGFAIVATAQYEEARVKGQRVKYPVHHLLMPAMAFVLAGYAIGVGSQPDSTVAGYIHMQLTGLRILGMLIGDLLIYGLGFWLILGAGYAFHNHINAKGLLVALGSQYVFCFAALGYFMATPDAPFTAIAAHITFAITSFIIVLIQTQE